MMILQVALGGALGAVGRFLVGQSVRAPLGTLCVNVLGSFLIGLVFVALSQKGFGHWQPFVITGVLGGFTTYSAFSLDVLKLYEGGQAGLAAAYAGGTLALCLIGVFGGVALGRGIWT